MWRNAKVSYIQYTTEMANILRQCLKEPYRSKALSRGQVHLKEAIWQGGVAQSKTTINDMKSAFGVQVEALVKK
ncbi:unnamed protein product [Vitrella brassicaformis CCMP3155]|uniref:Uncharacterized protein n=1 Tax=Vitrella brassicaformis (strain CCMP3155) TaxID=1169540 RepID=A0A0G4EQL9_VITBC|nr:unnamed protein product [Vitrella brassicaformis CCMP3155]|eukprot:CEL99533.1 unnamed protein product [Vitrella brassicaformis CCMP3155]